MVRALFVRPVRRRPFDGRVRDGRGLDRRDGAAGQLGVDGVHDALDADRVSQHVVGDLITEEARQSSQHVSRERLAACERQAVLVEAISDRTVLPRDHLGDEFEGVAHRTLLEDVHALDAGEVGELGKDDSRIGKSALDEDGGHRHRPLDGLTQCALTEQSRNYSAQHAQQSGNYSTQHPQ